MKIDRVALPKTEHYPTSYILKGKTWVQRLRLQTAYIRSLPGDFDINEAIKVRLARIFKV
jgi:hypothetical protein